MNRNEATEIRRIDGVEKVRVRGPEAADVFFTQDALAETIARLLAWASDNDYTVSEYVEAGSHHGAEKRMTFVYDPDGEVDPWTDRAGREAARR